MVLQLITDKRMICYPLPVACDYKVVKASEYTFKRVFLVINGI